MPFATWLAAIDPAGIEAARRICATSPSGHLAHRPTWFIIAAAPSPMPTLDTLQSFVRLVESGRTVDAMERFYAEHSR